MTMENKTVDVDRVLEDDEQCTMETTRMRPYLDIWDVSSHIQLNSILWSNISEQVGVAVDTELYLGGARFEYLPEHLLF
jgi:hypothetical protein